MTIQNKITGQLPTSSPSTTPTFQSLPQQPVLQQPERVMECSCTVVNKGSQEIDSHIFTGLHIDPQFLLRRSGSLSIHACSLLAAIRAQIQHEINGGCDIPPVFRSIFNCGTEDQNMRTQFDVATSRNPDFEQNLKSPMNGYRFLGNLGSFPIQFRRHTSPHQINRIEEVLAVGSASTVPNSSAISTFLSLWEPFGVKLDTHFILIFHPTTRSQSLAPPLALPAQNSNNMNGISHENSPSYSALLLTSSHESSPLCPTPSELPHSRSLSPLVHSGMHMLFGDPSSVPATSPPELSSHPVAQLPMDSAADYHNPAGENINLLSIFDVGTLLGLANVTTEEQNAAHFNSKAKNLFSMVTNFYAFRHILRKLGFTDQITSLDASYADGTQLSKISQFFSWTKHSYVHKSVWYGFAEAVSITPWHGSSPGNGM
jgi:hypothetical protein